MSLQKMGMSPYGPATFVKSPLVGLDDPWVGDVAVLGVPFDIGVGFRPGTRWGPKGIRDLSVRFGSVGAGGGYFDLRDRRQKGACRIVDVGDVEILPLDWEQNFDLTTNAVRHIRDNGAFPVVLGGDHSITYPVVRAFDDLASITVIHFDAHFDYRDEFQGVCYAHGNVLRRVRELPNVQRIISIGVRSLRTRAEDFADFQADDNVCIPAWDVHEKGAASFLDLIPTNETLYITFDIDGLDPAIAPGTGTPEVGGLSYEQARAFLTYACQRNKIAGFDLVEVNPSLDTAQITCLLAAQLVVEVIGFTHP